MNPKMTIARTNNDLPKSFQSVIQSISLIAITVFLFCSVVIRRRPQMKSKAKRRTIMVTVTTGVSSFKKSIKESPRDEPIKIFGGSPIRVAVPPMLEAKISTIR